MVHTETKGRKVDPSEVGKVFRSETNHIKETLCFACALFTIFQIARKRNIKGEFRTMKRLINFVSLEVHTEIREDDLTCVWSLHQLFI